MAEDSVHNTSNNHLTSPVKSLRVLGKGDLSSELTQNVLVGKDKKDETAIIYYLPAFLRFNMKNIKSISLDDLEAKINGTLLLTVYYGQISHLEPEVFQQILNSIVLEIDSDKSIQLKKSTEIQLKHQRDQRLFTYVIRKKITAALVGDLYWSPFESLDFIMNIKVSGFTLKNPIKEKKVSIKFNLLSHKDISSMLSTTLHNTEFGHYKLAENKLEAFYTNKRQLLKKQSQIVETDMQKHSSSYEFTHFKIKAYKNPFVAGSTIFCPLWFLGVINLSIFFQDATLSNRVASIAAMMIAFVALVPTIRGMIPPSPKILFVELLVYIQLLASLLCLIESLRINNLVGWEFDYTTSTLFLISLILNLFTFGSVMLLAIIHVLCWKPSYHVSRYKEYKGKFKREEWTNKECEKTFQYMKSKNEVAVFDPSNPIGPFLQLFEEKISTMLNSPEKKHKSKNTLDPLKVVPKVPKDKENQSQGKGENKVEDEDEEEGNSSDDSDNQD